MYVVSACMQCQDICSVDMYFPSRISSYKMFKIDVFTNLCEKFLINKAFNSRVLELFFSVVYVSFYMVLTLGRNVENVKVYVPDMHCAAKVFWYGIFTKM